MQTHIKTSKTIWRIIKRCFSETAFSGEGARLFGGRWNQKGESVVYTSENRSLALLEMLVQDQPLHADYVLISAKLPESFSILTLPIKELPSTWRDMNARETLQKIGSYWIKEGKTCVLEIPSVVVPAESNFLLNPAHPDFSKIKISTPENLQIDPRLIKKIK